jgi:type I restriction enzyme S subunit
MTQQPPLIDIKPEHWAIVREILQTQVPEYEVWAFGSRATGKAKEYSDLDLAILTDKPLSLDVSARVRDAFSESDLPWKVDVVDLATASDTFKANIERHKVILQTGN